MFKLSTFFAFVFLISSTAFAQQIALPQHLPQDFNSNEGKRALRNWAQRWTQPQENIRVDTIKYKNKSWLQVYYKLDFKIMEDMDPTSFMGEIFLKALNKSIDEATSTFDSTGKKIRAHFVADISVSTKYKDSESTDYRTNGIFAAQPKNKSDVMPITIYLYDPMSSFWEENQETINDGTGRSFAKITEGKIFLSYNDMPALVHEINHVLLGNADAYYEPGHTQTSLEDENMLCEFNTQSCDPRKLNTLEIYMGLRLRGYEAPGWAEYARGTL